jgi:cysteine desulfurase
LAAINMSNMINMNRIYLDHSATTPLDPRVLETILPYFTEQYGNSMAIHSFGREAERAIETARETVARLLNCRPHEVIFTSGGSESDNLALRGPAQDARTHNRPFTLITSPVEHSAISVTARQLRETLGAALRIVSVDRYGRVDPDDLRAALKNLPADGAALASFVYANNEIGTRNRIAELATIAHEHGALFHTDAVQATGYFSLDVQELGVDMLSLSSHKFYGPKGSGVFYLRDGVRFLTASTGAKHEDYRRAGTHNTPGIVGTAKAMELAIDSMPEMVARLSRLRTRLVEGVLNTVPDATLTGHPTDRLPGHASFAFKDVQSSVLLMNLDQHGIAASSGSACKVGNEKPSGILEALGYGPEWTRGGLRLTMGRHTTEAEIDTVLAVLPEAVDAVRKIGAVSY